MGGQANGSNIFRTIRWQKKILAPSSRKAALASHKMRSKHLAHQRYKGSTGESIIPREKGAVNLTSFHWVTEQAEPRILWKATPEGRLGDPYKTNTCQKQSLVLKNLGSVVVESGPQKSHRRWRKDLPDRNLNHHNNLCSKLPEHESKKDVGGTPIWYSGHNFFRQGLQSGKGTSQHSVFWSSPIGDPFLSAVKHPSTTIRMPSKVISGPFWPAESNRNLHLSIALLVVARLARTSPKSESKRFRPHIFIPSCSTNKLQSE